jgi:putative phosphoesterase
MAVTVAVISDTHLPRGARVLPPRCVELLRGADLILHCGDFVSAAFLDDLRAFGPPVQAVYGNMDEPALKDSLPKQRVVEVDGARIGMVHIPGPAAGRSARLRATFPECDAVIYGHTHLPEVVRDEGVWILNPGSPTENRKAPGHAMLVLDVEAGGIRPEFVEL